MQHEQPEIRRTVVYTLGELLKQQMDTGRRVPPNAIKTLRSALTDADPKVRRNAAVALGDLKSETSACDHSAAAGQC